MPESKATPGPWVVYEECNVETPAGRGIANCGFWRPVRNDHGSSRAENAANAHLITAAPDYYEAVNGDGGPRELRPIGALEAVLTEYEEHLQDAIGCGECDDPDAALEAVAEVREMVARLKAATAKAEGASHV
jgi:hypothetical protein